MKLFYKIIRAILLSAIGLVLIVPTLLYIGLELDVVQRKVCSLAEKEFSRLLNADVSIGSVSIAPFNRAWLRDVTIAVETDQTPDTVAVISRIGAGMDLYRLLHGDLVIGYAELLEADLVIRRDSAHAPLNIDPIIRAFAPRDTLSPPKRYDLQIRNIVLRRINLSYDVADSAPDTTRFDPRHIRICDLRADVRLPRLSNDLTEIDLRRLGFAESSGFVLSQLRTHATITPDSVHIDGLTLELPSSELELASLSIPLPGHEPTTWLKRLSSHPLRLVIKQDSHICPADLSPLLPAFSRMDFPVNIAVDAHGTFGSPAITRLNAEVRSCDLNLELQDVSVHDLLSGTENMTVRIDRLSVIGNAPKIARLLRSSGLVGNKVSESRIIRLIENTGQFSLLSSGSLVGGALSVGGNLLTAPGYIDFETHLSLLDHSKSLSAEMILTDFDLSELTDHITPFSTDFGPVTITASAEGNLRNMTGIATADIERVVYKGRELTSFSAEATRTSDGFFRASLVSPDPAADLSIALQSAALPGHSHTIDADIDIRSLDLSLLDPRHLTGHTASVTGDCHLRGRSADDVAGLIRLTDIAVTRSIADSLPLTGILIDSLRIDLRGDTSPKRVKVSSDIIDADLTGYYHVKSLIPELNGLISEILPALKQKSAHRNEGSNEFDFSISIHDVNRLSPLLKLPVTPITPLEVKGTVSTPARALGIDINAPYLRQGNKIIEDTHVALSCQPADSSRSDGRLSISSLIPAKTGKTRVDALLTATDNHIETLLDWRMDRDREFSGHIDVATLLVSDPDDSSLGADIHFNPGRMIFNDTAWVVSPSDIRVRPGRITVDNFQARGFDGQHISAGGVVSADPSDSLYLALDRIDLDYIFETLDISNAMFGGRATGNFSASALLSPMPRLATDDLSVKGIRYNHCLMGDAEIRSHWDPADKAVVINADIMGSEDNLSVIRGAIKPMTEELDFSFHADRVPVGFLLPFMEAFTSDIDGHASGDARLYGTFKLLDMTGDIYADAFRMKVDFTNCWYQTTDTVRLRPGRIDIPGVTLTDPEGHTATFSGLVTHKCFKEPEFDFRVTDARDLLVYDMGQTPDQNWYGKIYGNGGAHIIGVPGRIDIAVSMSTAPESTFTFVLSDAEQAYDYTFINFRDRELTAGDIIDSDVPKAVRDLREKLSSEQGDDSPSAYMLDITMDVNPNMNVILVMDPAGGDRIRAHGSGLLNMKYNSVDEQLSIHGAYTLSDGNYNFTLQDIIIKDFTISSGSKVEFFGDPYNARLDVEAIYQLNANLTDLDASFQQDREISRTNVPIQAILMVKGDISQPDIKFDLRFPTLTEDTYRKVRSIISTDDMMNRQMIYLLALNRFYTPEYTSGTKGNELVSVASSTISSQLSNLLGQLSDNWSIAPNFRSDRGDFSDVEFDVALSSRLLNNRLLLNGNLGYRDKTMNNNSFIGDFDMEYLLNRTGSLRLKAYNRYNDRNFYVKSALTTQGVGLMLRHDFDSPGSMLPFLKRRRTPDDCNCSPAEHTEVPADSTLHNVTL